MLAIALVLAATAVCPVEDAHYTLRHQKEVTMTFRRVQTTQDWPSGIAAAIYFAGSGHTYYFLPENGGSNDQQSFGHTTDVTRPGYTLPSPDGGPGRLGDIAYIATDANGDIIDHAPELGDPAPAHILLPELREVTWYGDPNARDAVEKQFFDLDGCGAHKLP